VSTNEPSGVAGLSATGTKAFSLPAGWMEGLVSVGAPAVLGPTPPWLGAAIGLAEGRAPGFARATGRRKPGAKCLARIAAAPG